MSETTFQSGDRVRVTRSRVHKSAGTILMMLRTRYRILFDTGGYGGAPYIEDIHPDRLVKDGA